MKLYLVQHGQAYTKEVDPQRALTDRGRVDIDRLASFLKRAEIEVARVVHSEKRRAQQTAKCLASAIAPMVEPEASGLLNPNDDPRAFDWQSESWDQDTLIVGHLPYLAKMVSHLIIGDTTKKIVAFEPGTLVCLERGDDTHWQVVGMIRPDLLK